VIRALELGAADVYSFEIDPLMHGIAVAHVADAIPDGQMRAKLINGDSAVCLMAIDIAYQPPAPSCPITLFLDAHGERETAVLRELRAVAEHWERKPDVILIDDRRCWPAWNIDEAQVRKAVEGIGPYAITLDTGVEPEDILVARRIV
jgi:hypothetical protein